MTNPVATVRTIDGHPVPAEGKWTADPSHSTVEFVARHLVVSKVRGRFTDYDATIEIAEKPEESGVVATIQAASITTGDETRDGHLRNADFFDVEQFPTLKFTSTKVTPTGETDWDVEGDLTIKDVTKPVTLKVEFSGVITDPWGGERAGFTASTEIEREKWGLTWNQALEGGGVVVSKKIKLELEIEAVKQV